MLVITAPAMIAIMTILLRDATADVGGLAAMGDGLDTAFSLVSLFWHLQQHAANQVSIPNVTRLHL